MMSVCVFRWSRPVAVVAAVWLVVQLAIAMLPSGYPVTVEVRLQDARCSLVRLVANAEDYVLFGACRT